MPKVYRFLALAAMLGGGAGTALSRTAQITGTVIDASDAAVATTNIRSSVTNEAGNYLFTSLFPGPYEIAASSSGFQRMRRDAMTLAVEQVARIDFRMEIGETKESVTVEATAVICDAANSTVGNVVENRTITELPLNWRNPLDLVGLSAGTRVQGGFGGKNGSVKFIF